MSDWKGDDWQQNRTDDAVITPGEQAYHAANEARRLKATLAERTKERDELREALADAVELIERSRKAPQEGRVLMEVHLPPDTSKFDGPLPERTYDIKWMRTLANLNKTDGE